MKTIMRLRECEIIYRARAVSPPGPRHISSSADVYALMQGVGAHQRAGESIWVLLLTGKNRVAAVHECARGGVGTVSCGQADIFRAAVLAGTNFIILIHNHPSGNPEPSPEDRAFTDMVCRAAKVLDMHVVDHIILGAETFYSFLDAGAMPKDRELLKPLSGP